MARVASPQSSRVQAGFFLAIPLLLLFWLTRLPALEALPLHNDEGLHLTRAVEVWNLHPFWAISDGKIINHWPIAVFYPQHTPVFAGRIATLLIGMIGLAAGYALARRFGRFPAAFAALLWIATPYLFFYERIALSDAEAGALVVLTMLAAARLGESGKPRDAMLTGVALGLAALFKFTAVPYALSVALLVLLLGNHSPRTRLFNLIVVGLTVAALFAVPLGYLLLRGRDFFATALGWIGGGSGGEDGLAANLGRLWEQLTEYGFPVWSPLLIAGLLLLVWGARREGWRFGLALFVPLTIMVVFGSEVLPRHYVVALPLALVLGGAGLGLALQRLPSRWRVISAGAVVVVLFVGFMPFAWAAYRDPGSLPLSRGDRAQFITDHSGGFGLRDAVMDFPTTLTRDLPVIASMFPDSCRRANFYATHGRLMECAQLPGSADMVAALKAHGAVYALVDDAPALGVDVSTLDARATRIAAYPRPGEDEATASIVLWLLESE